MRAAERQRAARRSSETRAAFDDGVSDSRGLQNAPQQDTLQGKLLLGIPTPNQKFTTMHAIANVKFHAAVHVQGSLYGRR